MKNKFICWCAFITLVFLCPPVTAFAADNPVGVAYRGHIQDVGDYPSDGSWVDSLEIIGTEGQSKRIEGFEIKLTGTIPEGMEMRYNVHVQNKGWLYDEDDVTNWPKDGAYAGTRGESLRIEAVKIVLTDSDGKPVSGYSVQYRGHVQNVGDLPADKSQWIKDGDQLGTVGSSLRLEALLVQVIKTQVEPVVYDKAGTYGPATGTEVINGDVIVKADGITLRNLHINGDLYIGEEPVAEKIEKSLDETINADQIHILTKTELQNLSIVSHIQMAAGTGVSITGSPWRAFSISLPGGTQFTATTPGGGAGPGAPMQITAGVSGGSAGGVSVSLSVGGPIHSLTLPTPGTQVSLSPGCQVQLLSVLMGAPNCGVITSPTALIQNLVVQGANATFGGPGPIRHADIQADWASFATRPGDFTVAPGVAVPPSMPAPPDPGGGGGYTPTQNPVTFSPAGGAMTFPATLALSSIGADAIYYTTDGSDPTTVAGATNTTIKTGATATITIDQAMTLKAIATRAGYNNSAIASATYTQAASADLTGIALSTPTDNFTFAPATYNYSSVTVPYDTQSITITPTGSGVITVDGKTATNGMPSELIVVSFKVEKIIEVVTKEQGKAPKTYTIKVTPGVGSFTPSQNPVTFSPTDGAMTFPATVTLSSTEAEAIYYTIDGSDPSTVAGATNTTNKPGDTVTFTIDQALTVKAIATRAGYLNSGVTSTSYSQAVSADLSSIVISPTAGSFNFASTTYDYPNVTVANDVESITVTPSGNSSSVIVNGAQLASHDTPIPVSYKIETTIKIVNQEQGKTPKTYTIKVTPSSGTVTPLVSTIKTAFTATATPLDLNTSGIFGIKPGTSGVLSNVVFASNNTSMIASGSTVDGKIPILKDGTVTLTFTTASVTLQGETTKRDVSLTGAVTITSTAYLTKVNSGTGTVADYAAAGITGVVDGNLSGINQAVAAARAAAAGAELNKDAIQTVVAGYLAGANNFTVALENSNSKIQTEAFNLNITSAKDSEGNLLSGNKTITVTSDQCDLSYNQVVTFANGAVMVPISLSKIGAHTLTVAVAGMTTPPALAVMVYSKLNFSPANTVSGYTATNDVVVIPPDNNGTPVTAIGNDVFAKTDDEYTNNVQSITAVTIPASVTAIGASAFKNCKNLTTVTFTGTSKLETIGTDAFKSCITLTPFTIPASVITIGDGAFYSCTAFNIVTFADNSLLSSIGNGAFQACTMKTITIPANVTTIATLAFQICLDLTTVNFAAGSKLTTISDSTFNECSKLSTIQIPASVINIGSLAFHGCALLDTVTFETGSALKNIKIYAFNGCPLTTITNIPAGVTIDPTAATMGKNGAGFKTLYDKTDSSGGAGTYTYSSPTWSK